MLFEKWRNAFTIAYVKWKSSSYRARTQTSIERVNDNSHYMNIMHVSTKFLRLDKKYKKFLLLFFNIFFTIIVNVICTIVSLLLIKLKILFIFWTLIRVSIDFKKLKSCWKIDQSDSKRKKSTKKRRLLKAAKIKWLFVHIYEKIDAFFANFWLVEVFIGLNIIYLILGKSLGKSVFILDLYNYLNNDFVKSF